MIENVLIVDLETTGLHPEHSAQIIELGAILYNIKHKAILQQFSTLIPCNENPVQHINNINPEITKLIPYYPYWEDVLTVMVNHAKDVCVAHNAQFDKKFLLHNNRFKYLFADTKWICTKNDFKWPVPLKRNRLQDVCEAMGVPYVNAHRSLADCTFIAQCFSKVEDLQQRIDGVIK